ncbi:hypothetical protein HK103_000609 [Boothiomyces macroporosus]|uniref:SET domain-containing protein n=1 Tax=Boothiomyces macroporosus TaxID=261099 RepID=A0AAD5UN23_9FUNG|nr:hypothetical protein HK103_000609 [Boothiomyces macroporosus]
MKKVKYTPAGEDLLEWARENGATVTNLQIYNEDSLKEVDRGVKARNTIASGEEICFIPNAILLSESVALNSEIGKLVANHLKESHAELISPEHYPHGKEIICMAVFMVYEKYEATDSHWASYLNSLPKDYNLPVCWAPDAIAGLLGGTNLEYITFDRLRWFQQIVPAVEECAGHLFNGTWNLENFLWAYASITSRAFPKAKKDEKYGVDSSTIESDWISISELCLYPVLDMLNHKRGFKIEWRMKDNGVAFIAREEIPKGSDVFNNYGPKGNENLLGNYGFVLDPNPENYFKISLNNSLQDPFILKRRDLFQKNSISRFHMLYEDDVGLKRDLLIAASIFVANEYELDCFEEYEGELDKLELWRNRSIALTTLYQLLDQKLRNHLSGEIQMNSYVLRGDQTPLHLAKVYRSGQITIIQNAMNLILKEYPKLLESKELCKSKTFFHIAHHGIDKKFQKKLGKLKSNEYLDEDVMLILCLIHSLYSSKSPWKPILTQYYESFSTERCEELLL